MNPKHFNGRCRKIIALFVLCIYSLQITAAAAFLPYPASSQAVSSVDANGVPSATNVPTATSMALPPLSISSDKLGLPGALSWDATYDTLLGTVFNGQYAQKVNDFSALSVLGEYGSEQYRLNATAGFQVYPHGLFKVGGEYLSQVLPFNFDSGSIDERVGQSAYGFDFQHQVNQAALKNINLGGYWAKAPNVSLETIQFTGDDDYEYINQRNLAGATSQGLDFGGTLTLTPLTSLDVALNYDDVYYHTELTDNETDNTSGMGGTLKVNQLIGDRMKLSAEASNRTIYNTYGIDLAYAPPFAREVGLKVGLFIQRLVSSNDTPSSNTYGLQLSFLGDEPTKSTVLGDNNQRDITPDLVEWVKSPAVYMDRVMITAEQITTLAAANVTSVVPDTGPIAGGNTVTLYGTNFFPTTQVYFNGQAGTVTYISSHELSVIVPALALSGVRIMDASFSQPVDITLNNPDGQSAVFTSDYTYTQSAASITEIAPTSGSVSGGTVVTISGTYLENTSSVTFGGTAGDNLSVNDAGTALTVTTPEHTEGSVDVVVTTPAGALTQSDGFTYVPVPTLSSISPTSGATSGGTSVVITGTNLTDATIVSFGVTNATSYTVDSATQITAITPSGSAGGVDVSVTTVGGTATDSSAYTYVTAPTVTSVAPTSGSTAGGETVTITGTGFNNATQVVFGGTTFTSGNFTNAGDGAHISLSTPAHTAGAVDVSVTTAGGTGTGTNVYTYISAPTITGISPASGATSGGASVVITGTNLTDATTVSFGSTNATSYTVDSATQITAITPSGSAGAVDVSVTTVGGTANDASAYTYVTAPTVTSVAPTSGSTAGGETVTITGTGFNNATQVVFGGTTFTSGNFTNAGDDTHISLTAPAHTAGAVNVSVTTAGGTGTGTNVYTYVSAPTVTSVSPTSGSTAGGETVTITGTGFNNATQVVFGGTTFTSGNFTNAGDGAHISLSTPAHTAGAVDVSVTTAGGTGTGTNVYTYISAPTITGISPASGATSGGASVVITGTNLTDATTVSFGSTNATSYTVDSATQITAITPSGSAGAVDVSVTTVGGTATDSSAYTYVTAPTVISVSPTSGSTAGGDTVTITGTGFNNATQVVFGGTTFTSGNFINAGDDAHISLTAPAHTAGAVNVSVTTAGGTGTGTNVYTYISAPTITGISPTSGTTAGGNSVIITGTNLTGASAVTFGAVNASSYTVNNATQITAVSPAGSAGTVDLAVTTVDGTATASNAYTYNSPAIIFVTASTFNGNLGGLAGATQLCNADLNKPSSGFAAGYTYKAMLNGNNATTAGVNYFRADGTTFIAQATGGNLIGAASLVNEIETSGHLTWTGANAVDNCTNWTTNDSSINGNTGLSSSRGQNYWAGSSVPNCSLSRNLYCVSQ